MATPIFFSPPDGAWSFFFVGAFMELKNQPKPNSPKVGEPQPFHTDASENHLGMVLKPMVSK